MLCGACVSARVRKASVRWRGNCGFWRGTFPDAGTAGAGRSCGDSGVIGGVAAVFAACCMYARRPCSCGVGVGVLRGVVSNLDRTSSVRCRGISEVWRGDADRSGCKCSGVSAWVA